MAYEFTQEGFNEFSRQILDAQGDQGTLTTILADMQETFSGAVNTQVENTEKIEKLTNENEHLLKKNMDLFLRIGQNLPTQQSGQQPSQQKAVGTTEYMTNYIKSLK